MARNFHSPFLGDWRRALVGERPRATQAALEPFSLVPGDWRRFAGGDASPQRPSSTIGGALRPSASTPFSLVPGDWRRFADGQGEEPPHADRDALGGYDASPGPEPVFQPWNDRSKPELVLLAGKKSGGKKSAAEQRAKKAAEQAKRQEEEEARRGKGHTKNRRPSSQPKHERGAARQGRDAGAEKRDARRKYDFSKPQPHLPEPLVEGWIRRMLPPPPRTPEESDADYERRMRPWV